MCACRSLMTNLTRLPPQFEKDWQNKGPLGPWKKDEGQEMNNCETETTCYDSPPFISSHSLVDPLPCLPETDLALQITVHLAPPEHWEMGGGAEPDCARFWSRVLAPWRGIRIGKDRRTGEERVVTISHTLGGLFLFYARIRAVGVSDHEKRPKKQPMSPPPVINNAAPPDAPLSALRGGCQLEAAGALAFTT